MYILNVLTFACSLSYIIYMYNNIKLNANTINYENIILEKSPKSLRLHDTDFFFVPHSYSKGLCFFFFVFK